MAKSKAIKFKSKTPEWKLGNECDLFYHTIDADNLRANHRYYTQEDFLGFVYKIINLKTGKFYIGQKKFWVGSRPPSAYKKKKPKKSDWEEYWSSCNELKEDLRKYGTKNFERTILQCYFNKWDMSYNELLLQLKYDVLSPNTNTYNSYVGCRLRKRKNKS